MTSWSLAALFLHLWISAFIVLYFYSINEKSKLAYYFLYLFSSSGFFCIGCSGDSDQNASSAPSSSPSTQSLKKEATKQQQQNLNPTVVDEEAAVNGRPTTILRRSGDRSSSFKSFKCFNCNCMSSKSMYKVVNESDCCLIKLKEKENHLNLIRINSVKSTTTTTNVDDLIKTFHKNNNKNGDADDNNDGLRVVVVEEEIENETRNQQQQNQKEKKPDDIESEIYLMDDKEAFQFWISSHVPKLILALIKLSWLLYNLIAIAAIVVTIGYFSYIWIFELDMKHTWLHELGNLHRHGFNSIVAIVDILLLAYPVRIHHHIYTNVYGWLYALVIFIYWLVDTKKNIIYEIIDYNKPLRIILIYVSLTLKPGETSNDLANSRRVTYVKQLNVISSSLAAYLPFDSFDCLFGSFIL